MDETELTKEVTVELSEPTTGKRKRNPKTIVEKIEKAEDELVQVRKNLKTKMEKPKITENDVKNVKIKGYQGLEINTYVFDKIKSPKAVVVIAHGMMEHALRYAEFARFLNKHQFVAIAPDLRGHGHTAECKERLGYGENDIYNETIKDFQKIVNYVDENYNLPLYWFGHSYGSLLSQKFIQICPQIEKCVLCGTTNGSSLVMKAGGFASKLFSLFKKDESKGGLIEKMCIKAYGNGFERENWLTRDESAYDEYLQDELCGGSFPFGFYKSLITNMNKVNEGINKIGNKKILFIVGDDDPLSSGGDHVKTLHKLYLEHNIDARLKIYPGARHELINEINKFEIFEDIVNFYND